MASQLFSTRSNLPIFLNGNNYLLNLEEKEVFTQQTWKGLITKVLGNSTTIPYYMLGINKGKFGFKFYDGIALNKYYTHKLKNKDPLTNLCIEKTYFVFLKTFDLNGKGEPQQISIENLKFSNPDIDWQNLDSLKEGVVGLNIHALSSHDKRKKKIIGDCQYIFGANLLLEDNMLKKREGIRWLICAANNYSQYAAETLTHCYQKGYILARNQSSAHHWKIILEKNKKIDLE